MSPAPCTLTPTPYSSIHHSMIAFWIFDLGFLILIPQLSNPVFRIQQSKIRNRLIPHSFNPISSSTLPR
jgi:hypothetical protein